MSLKLLLMYVHAGDQQVTMNVHLLSHVTNCVRNWGPLWCYSCFQFESMNKEVKKLFRGTRNMSKQVHYGDQSLVYNALACLYITGCIDGLLLCDAAGTTSCYIADVLFSSGI